MEVIMTSPVQECLMMENGGGDDSAKLTKSKKRRQKKKKHAASVPISGDANTGSKREDHMETSSNMMISDTIATPDAKIVAKGEEGTTATDSTVSKKRKRLRKKKNQSSNDMVTVEKDLSKTATDDVKMVSKGEETGTDVVKMVSDTTATDHTVPKKKKSRKKKKKNQEASNDMVNVEKDSTKTETNDAKMVSKGENHTKVTNANKGLIKTTKSYKNGRVTEQKIHRSTERGQNKDKQEGKKHEVCYASMGAKRVKMESVIQTGKEKVSGTTKPGKKLLIFDINGLLADIVSPRPQDVQADYYIPKRAIFKRPYLDGFLRFCFERFNVGIWSSRTKQVLYPVVDFLLGDLKKNLLFIWDNSFCTNTGMKTLEDKYKPMVFKDLRKIWLKWLDGTFHESNTLLLDDSPYKALLNPKNTAIFPLSYSYKDRNDDFLGPNGDLRKYLEGLADTEDVKTYVEQHPFGQSAIDQTHPSWAFYAKALKSQK